MMTWLLMRELVLVLRIVNSEIAVLDDLQVQKEHSSVVELVLGLTEPGKVLMELV